MNLKRTVGVLIVLSVLIYSAQLLIFRDPNTTAFYILQDVAFLPISIAVATIVVGEYLGQKEKRERQEKTQMLTSSFYTELGSELMQILFPLAVEREPIKQLFRETEIHDNKSLDLLREKLKQMPLHVQLNPEAYGDMKQLIEGRRELLLVISSNPLLLDHADFTKMLWGVFHLMDEFRLRGEYEEMCESDLAHLESDFSDVLRLLIINWARNVLYMKNNYPNLYGTAMEKLFQRIDS